MVDQATQVVRNGQPRSERDRVALTRYERFALIPIILAAVVPLFVLPQKGDPVSVGVAVVSWLIFVLDFSVHERRLTRYLATRVGRFDLTVVVLTAPWFLLPGASAGKFVVLLRLARLARIVIVSRGARRLLERLGEVAIAAAGITLLGSLAAYHAEHPTNPEFATVGDSLWWGVVTLTTVGYGDIVPKTPQGRLAGVAIMITGIATLGVLSGSLASFFRAGSRGNDSEHAPDETDKAIATAGGAASSAEIPMPASAAAAVAGEAGAPTPSADTLSREVALLREQIQRLSDQVARMLPGREAGST